MAEKTGWSKKEILDCAFSELLLYMADAPKLTKKKDTPDSKTIETDEELADWLGIEKKPEV